MQLELDRNASYLYNTEYDDSGIDCTLEVLTSALSSQCTLEYDLVIVVAKAI